MDFDGEEKLSVLARDEHLGLNVLILKFLQDIQKKSSRNFRMKA